MSDLVKIGLDFGTHQTKVCIQRTPDEGHGHPIYEFFRFKDLKGNDSYFLPSIVQINDDDTLSYGFVNPERERTKDLQPIIHPIPEYHELDIESEIQTLKEKYSFNDLSTDELKTMRSIIKERNVRLLEKHEDLVDSLETENENNIKEYVKKKEVFRYFKQATFSERNWIYPIDHKLISIWYLSYVLLCLGQVDDFYQNFSLNMGIPVSDKTYKSKKEEAVSILLSAYRLAEDVYDNDINAFLGEKMNSLIEKTVIVPYDKDLKDNKYFINIFPEAYASMTPLTTQGKITPGMCLAVDIGGGTTDVSFFTIKDQKPHIYRYWSMPKGLNYIAEESGYDYQQFTFEENAQETIIHGYNHEKTSIINSLFEDITRQIKNKDKYKSQIRSKLESGVVVYNGGGSIYSPLTTNMKIYFNDVRIINSDMWKEENIINKDVVAKYCKILTTSYGLSLCGRDNEEITHDYQELFEFLGIEEPSIEREYIGKEQV